ncbi:MipA/OmpV family protein [Qipengyuania sp. JC766]|uniref:MipA/OmpV family protein n=1 Tax=Qipengyuania sp. JC766 TaxID=3232139 RepID=UPI003459F747
MKTTIAAFAALLSLVPVAAAAQDAGEPGVSGDTAPDDNQTDGAPTFEGSALDGDFISLGIGVGIGSSYTGSDDYVAFPVPLVQGSLGGVDINPRPAGIALDFLPDGDGDTSYSLGVTAKLNRDRVSNIQDEVVEAYGKLDTAVEVGPTAGISFSGVLNPFDTVSLTVDTVWDVAGAHNGMAVSPSITYFTPVSRGAAVSLSVGTKWIDDDYADYYYSVAPLPGTAPGDANFLPAYQADSGIENYSINLIGLYDLNGNLLDGGLAIFGIAGYSTLQGDARNTPFTSIRGSSDQFIGGIGIGYTF